VEYKFLSVASLLLSSIIRFVLQGHYEILSDMFMQGVELKIS